MSLSMSWFFLFMLIFLVVGSGLGVVFTEFTLRKRFVELEHLHIERDALQVEWGQLQLEQSTLATPSRIEKLARKRLKMRPPQAHSLVLIRP